MFGNYSLPWINGFLTIVLLGISACLIIKLFDIYDTLECILVSDIMITFPTVTCLMNFMFTSYYYGIAILLAFTACYLAIKNKYGFVLALILIGCATGTYQSFFILAAGILLLYLIKDCMSKSTSTKDIFHESFKFLLLLLTALLFYLIINKSFFTHKANRIDRLSRYQPNECNHPSRNLVWYKTNVFTIFPNALRRLSWYNKYCIYSFSLNGNNTT